MPPRKKSKSPATSRIADPYQHTVETLMRPEVGMQAQFRKKKAPKKYRYDDSLDPALSWDGQNSARDLGEWLLAKMTEASKLPSPHLFDQPQKFIGAGGEVILSVRGLEEAVTQLGKLGKPFLDWSGKAERLSMDVPTLPLFVHERLSTKAILETLKGHVREGVDEQFGLFGDKRQPLAQKLRPYEHAEKWENRMILGDSLVVMNSLLEYEGMGGKVQMIYMDPPYGVKFGSNFQPFIRKRDVKHNDDADLTREPEMVQAYRDTWELGLHSYLTYLRDRLQVARDLLTPSGSVFVQISDENLHHVREVMDEIFGAENLVSIITFKKTSGAGSPSGGTDVVASVTDFLIWYARDRSQAKYRAQYAPKGAEGDLGAYTWIELTDGSRRRMSSEERQDLELLPDGARIFRADNLTSQSGVDKTRYPVFLDGHTFRPSKGVWKTSEEGMQNLLKERRVIRLGDTLSYVRFMSDFPVQVIPNFWEDTVISGYSDPKI